MSPWVSLVEKEIQQRRGQPPQIYHCLQQQDYVAVLACTRSGRIPIVRQYRPAVETYTWELPAGLLESRETPEAACRRELYEETGLTARSLVYLGAYYADTGRLENRIHGFFARTSEPDPAFMSEPDLSVAFVTPVQLRRYIVRRIFRHQLHIALLSLVLLRDLSPELFAGL